MPNFSEIVHFPKAYPTCVQSFIKGDVQIHSDIKCEKTRMVGVETASLYISVYLAFFLQYTDMMEGWV